MIIGTFSTVTLYLMIDFCILNMIMAFASVIKRELIKTNSCGSSLEMMGRIINMKHPTILFAKYHL